MTLVEIRDKQQKLVADARAKLDEMTADVTEARAKEIEAEHDKIMAEVDRLEARAQREEKLAAREAELNAADERRPLGEDRSVRPGDDARTPEQRYADAFRSYLRGGVEGLSREERGILRREETRGQAVNSNTQGGYLAPGEFMSELVRSLKAWGPMFDDGVTRVINTASGVELTWPTVNDTANEGALIAENQQVTATEVAFGTKMLNAHKYTSGVVLVSDELLQDAVMPVEAIVRDLMAERIGRIGNKHLTTGDGASKPSGVVAAAGAGATAAGASAITLNDLIDLEHSVDPAYRSDPSCAFMFNDATLKALRKLKDSDGNYIWQPADARSGAPATLFNYRYAINQAMADVGTTNKSVVFGAMNRYIVRIVMDFAMRRLVERYADYGQIGLIGFMRMDGDLMDTGAVKVLTHP